VPELIEGVNEKKTEIGRIALVDIMMEEKRGRKF
jgi:hypothetical protein